MQKAKQWVWLYLLILAVGTGAYMAVCYHANPLGYFTNAKDIPYFDNEDYARKIKATYLYEHRGAYEGVLVGGSKCGAIDPSLMTQYTGLSYYNMYMNVGNFTDYLRFCTFLTEQCQVKEITLMLSGFETKYPDQSSRGNVYEPPAILSGSWFQILTERLGYLMTDLNTTVEELKDPVSAHVNTSDFLADGMRNRWSIVRSHQKDPEKATRSTVLKNEKNQLKKLFRQSASAQTERALCLDCLRQIKALCDEKNVALRVIMGPSFLLDKARYECSEYYEYFEEAVRICGSIWDFSGYNRYNRNPYNFYDRSHYSRELAGRMLQQVFASPQEQDGDDFGILLTKDNVHAAMQQRQAAFEAYKQEYETTGCIAYEGLEDDSYLPWAAEWTSPGMQEYQNRMNMIHVE